MQVIVHVPLYMYPCKGNRLFPFSHMTETEKEHYYGTLRPVKECMKQDVTKSETEKEHYYGTLRPVKECMKQDVTKRLQTQQQKGGRTDQK